MQNYRLAAFKNLAGWLLVTVTVAVIASRFFLPAVGCGIGSSVQLEGGDSATSISNVGLAFAVLAFAVIGRLLTLFRPENRIGWLVAGVGFTFSITNALVPYVDCALAPSSNLPLPGISAWLMMVSGNIAIILIFMLLPALFPTGSFLSRKWKNIVTGAVSIITFLLLITAVTPGTMNMNSTVGPLPIDNPFGLPLPGLRRLEAILFIGTPLSEIFGGVLGIAAFIARFRGSTRDERQQLKWFAFFLSTVVIVHLVGFELIGGIFYPAIFEHWIYGIIVSLSFSGFPIVIGLAVFKYRLYDIDLIIRRTLLYSLLTGMLSIIYFGVVTLLQAALSAIGGPSSALAIVLTTLLIYILFNPLRLKIQDYIDRRFYRQKYNAELALAKFADIARGETDLEQLTAGMVKVAQESLQPQSISVWLNPFTGMSVPAREEQR